MRRSLLLTLVLALAAAAVALAVTGTSATSPDAERAEGPSSFSAAVAGSDGSSSPSVAPAAAGPAGSDPTTWGQDRDSEYGQLARKRLAGRLTRLVLTSSAARLDVRPEVLTDAVRKVASAHRRAARLAGGLSAEERTALRACRRYRNTCDREAARAAYLELRAAWPGRTDLSALRDELARGLARELRRPRAEILAVARAEVADRLDQGVELGVVTSRARRVTLDCFDAPSACDVGELHRELRTGRLLG
jgi:hypothetical protein